MICSRRGCWICFGELIGLMERDVVGLVVGEVEGEVVGLVLGLVVGEVVGGVVEFVVRKDIENVVGLVESDVNLVRDGDGLVNGGW